MYRDAEGARVTDEEALERIRSLAIPPAWRHVRIAASPRARVQARGVDAAGRTQYLYHAGWRERQEARKFRRALGLAERLPGLRRRVTEDLRGKRGPRAQALAAAVRIIDRTGMRVGGHRYARENGTFGVTTVQREHVSLEGDAVAFDFPGKSGLRWEVVVTDPDLAAYLRALPRRPAREPALGYDDGHGFQPVSASALNEYLRGSSASGVSAKDLRTWRATVVAARSLARSRQQEADADTAWRDAVAAAAEWLHNTPAVARSSYVDPHLLEAYQEGRAVAGPRASERSVCELLRSARAA
ncbi:DNA topoisomerase IB [Sinomonas halotolerans]|uniref:DNA topoisomerase n=1 Tax=Sinomonas halotolerans TaxID=1644133 RepID=A0ABU9X089_9MICC